MFNFEESAEVEDITAVPEQFRGFYVETEGKHVLAMDNPVVKGAVEAITGLNKALGSERKVAKELRGKKVDLSPLADFGATPEEIKAALDARIKELEGQIADPKKARLDIEKVKADLALAHKAEKEQATSTINGLRSQLDTLMVEQAARTALSGLTDDPDLSLPLIQRQVQVVEEEGIRKVFVVDETGAQRYNPATQQAMTVADLVSEMKDTPRYARLFNSEAPRGPVNPGPGARRPAAPAGGGADRSPTEKIAAGIEKLRAGR